MRKQFLIATGAAALLALSFSAAHATVVTFDEAAVAGIVDTQVSSFSDGGLDFSGNAGSLMYIWDGSNPNGNGSQANIFAGFAAGDTETITRTGGGTFNLNSLDLALSWYDGNSTETILINGNPLTISQTLTTYNLNLTGVTSVTITGVPSGAGYWLADNISYSAGVPEPASWAMMLMGFFGIGSTVRAARRRTAAAVA